MDLYYTILSLIAPIKILLCPKIARFNALHN